MTSIELDGTNLSPRDLVRAAVDDSVEVRISSSALTKVAASRMALEKILRSGRVVYGVNTGVGGFVDRLIPDDRAAEMQQNLVAGVATNVGQPVDRSIIRAMMIARLNSLARGNSAVKVDTLLAYVKLVNSAVVPLVPALGSLGASGDLGPLAHIAQVLQGKGRLLEPVSDVGTRTDVSEVLKDAGLEPVRLDYKEGLALINGTSGMVGYAAVVLDEARRMLEQYEVVTCLSFEALSVRIKPFDPVVHAMKSQSEQLAYAHRIYDTLRGSNVVTEEDELSLRLNAARLEGVRREAPIEDAYSIRCAPQIMGAVMRAMTEAETVVERELNSSSDNPLVSPEIGDVFHNGHFHGQYVAMVIDYVNIAFASVANISDRRTDRILDEKKNVGLPPFLTKDPGATMGLMGGQFMSTSLTSEIRSMCVPMSIQTLPSTGDFQDVVSLGFVAARKSSEILRLLRYVLSFELLCAYRAVELREVQSSLSSSTEKLWLRVRQTLDGLNVDAEISEAVELLAGSGIWT